MSDGPLSAASLRLRKPPGRPRKIRAVPEPAPTVATSDQTLADQAHVCSRSPASMRVPVKAVAEVWLCPPRLLSLRAACAYLSVSSWTLRAYLADGRLTRVRLPGTGGEEALDRLLIDRLELDALVEKAK
ncbi:MAG TPA: hypothetical protein VGF25_19770 [Thermoleophilaceae bacterium]